MVVSTSISVTADAANALRFMQASLVGATKGARKLTLSDTILIACAVAQKDPVSLLELALDPPTSASS